MDQEEIWAALAVERRGLADLLAALPAADWERPSLCAGWRVRDVAAHLTFATAHTGRALAAFARARGDFDRAIHDSAVRLARRLSPERIVAEIRRSAGSHRRAPSTKPLDPLFDVLVHGQDIAVPLGLDRAVPVAAARACVAHVWGRGFPFHPQRRFAGLRFAATDAGWAGGAGERVEGPVGSLLLVLSGRAAGLAGLTGPGVPELAERLTPTVRAG
ncbi:maleylpyruvate isomerase family mycothiol-dependent enzyme [Actinomadura sp. ATCC 31491]|uniref:Maleylpyruvate isomerase family mycothiol-dependent enzyme n=1 Tax=Actinomadura luzonensis TaxID=2805427 RepID=A0ABT0FRG5_9ACTN|nr:maleylpyruvate isomerase family mycothiol-dependent enzyme [Actinomadura luzonensis]MCK2214909.1 maleylpyruvate isomerase family mycothiol-dependent enzyme [Actinomadura luzonensis]